MSGETYLSMSGGSLAQYMLALQANENLLLQLLLRNPGCGADEGAAIASFLAGAAPCDGVPCTGGCEGAYSCVASSSAAAAPYQSVSVPAASGVLPVAVSHLASVAAANGSGLVASMAEAGGACGSTAGAPAEEPVEQALSEVLVLATTHTAPAGVEVVEHAAIFLSVPGRSLSGEYVLEAGLEHHGRPVFAKKQGTGSRAWPHGPLYCYFWDSREGPSEWRGWWIGSEVGGNRVSAFAPEVASVPAAGGSAAGASAEGRPFCPSGAPHEMEWTARANYVEYSCNRCGGSFRGERWHCAEHQADFCLTCGEAAATAGIISPFHSALLQPPTQGWQIFGLSPETREVPAEELSIECC